MKKTIFISVLSAFALVSCGKDKPVTSEVSEVTTTSEGVLYQVDTLNSKVQWKGFKVLKTDNTSHIGSIKFESGDVTVKDGKLESGKFVVNMSSLENEDVKDEEMKTKLESHLKSEDFFEVEKFPTASFEITKITDAVEGGDYNAVLDGNLTIKGITKPMTFNANVSIKEGEISIATEQKDIDREVFGVSFQSPIENGVIKNEINVQVLVKALEKK